MAARDRYSKPGSRRSNYSALDWLTLRNSAARRSIGNSFPCSDRAENRNYWIIHMRGFIFLLIFISCLPLIFVSPFYGVLIWYVFSLGDFHTITWGILENLHYAYIIAILTCISWAISRREPKKLPLTPLSTLTLLFSVWITITSFFALGPSEDVWRQWELVQKILLMCLVGYALTTTRERVDQLVWVVVFAIGIWGVKGTISVALHGGVGYPGIHGPDEGVMADNNEFGIALIMILPLLFYQWHIAANRHVRRGLLVMGFLISLAVIFTYSRGAFLGLSAMGAVFWLRSRAKLATALLVLAVALAVYGFVPQTWFDRMAEINDPENPRIWIWQVCLRIAELHPTLGGGFRVTFWPAITNAMLVGTNLQLLVIPRAAHSIWLDALSEHGWPGLALFVAIAGYSLLSCSWLIRHTRGRTDLAWANLLGRMGQASLVGFWVSGTFASLAYFDEYWCIIFIFDAARRIVARQIATSVSALRVAPAVAPVPAGALARSDQQAGYARVNRES
jgi:putative inorganic carbon (hco3(-)) transporter